jgi:hypothetical protein
VSLFRFHLEFLLEVSKLNQQILDDLITFRPVEEMKGRIFSLPFTVFGASDFRRAIESLPKSIRESRITEGKLLRRVERLTSPVLDLHRRSNKVELFLYQYQFPRALVWKGRILVISDSLADSLYDGELVGIVAHEMGHAYFMDETVVAQKNGDDQTMRIVELKCDAVAMLTLKSMARDPTDWLQGLRRVIDFTRHHGYESTDPSHPSIVERGQFAQRFIKLLV